MTTEFESVSAEVALLREREAAMREILQVISASRTDPAPVFETILNNAARLSSAPLANLCILNDARSHWTLVAHYGEGLRHLTVGKTTRLSDSKLVPAVSMRTASVVHVEDLVETDLYRQGDPGRVAMVEEEGMRTILGVPLLLDGDAIGCITLFRREVKAFTRDDINLVETFADQAVIAIENTRQFREVQDRLERQRATSDVLEVISQSRDDEQPVFGAILENAQRLCHAPMGLLGILNREQTHIEIASHIGAQTDYFDFLTQNPPEFAPDRFLAARAMHDLQIIQVEDIARDGVMGSEMPHRDQAVAKEGMRTVLFVPMQFDGKALGCIILYRRDVQQFTDQEIKLVETFAAQAVIAIENVRQFREVQERLLRERANREILEVISLNPDDEQPVFDAIINRAAKLCRAPHAGLLLRDADDRHLIMAAANTEQSGYVDYLKANPHSMDDQTSLSVEAVRAMEVRQYPDIEVLAGGTAISEQLKNTWKLERMRTLLYVPLIKGDRAIGAIALYRLHVEEFSDDDIEMLKLFAAQAVIAIDNVRQFKALETLNAELGDRVQSQVGELERMGRLKRFLPTAVADAVVSAGDESMLSSHRALVATLFCDMRGFTAFCEAAEPEETIEVLQSYHQEMSELIDEYGGGVDQRAGDGIMVIFNDPIPADDPAGDAVRLALAMRDKMRELCAKWKKLGHRLGFGVGISFGYATVGLVGSAGRYDYTASGTSINTAARLCDMAANDEILISPRTWAAVEGDVKAESRGEVEMKGIREPVEVFAVVAK